MGRPKRIIASGLTYHTFSRCINHEKLFENDYFKDLIISVIDETLEKYSFQLNAYQIMPDHIHLVITTNNDLDTISKIMQRIKSVTARRYNKKMNRTGPFWNERFGSTIVSYFPTLNIYLGYNPVRAGLIDSPSKEKYGSYKYYFDHSFECPLKITFHKHFLELGSTDKERQAKLAEFESIYWKLKVY